MKKNKVVASCTPESLVVDINAMPNYQSEAMCRTLLGCINKYFENPVVKAKYEAWLAERQMNEQ